MTNVQDLHRLYRRAKADGRDNAARSIANLIGLIQDVGREKLIQHIEQV